MVDPVTAALTGIALVTKATEHIKQGINAYAPFKLAQRYIALMFTFTFISCFVLIMGMTLAGKGDIEGVKAI